MKILMISHGQCPDFQCDQLFHGLRLLYGDDVVDQDWKWYMYVKHAHTMYGVCLPDNDIDRSDVPAKIRARYYDLVIYGSIHRRRDFWDDVMQHYPANRIVFIDGEDEGRLAEDVIGRGWYFKRELTSPYDKVLPIQFAIPAEKIVHDIPAKTRLLAPLIPGQLDTYIYPVEEDYYRMYGESYFGYTWRKGGWDCQRHYEIILSGCLPYFRGLEDCPPTIMQDLPKDDLFRARALCDSWSDCDRTGEYADLLARVRHVLATKLTTEALAKRVIGIVTA